MKNINLYLKVNLTSESPDSQIISLGIVSDDVIEKYGCPKCRSEKGPNKMHDSFHYKCEDCGQIISARDYAKGIKTDSVRFYTEFNDFDINRCDDCVKEDVLSKLGKVTGIYCKSTPYVKGHFVDDDVRADKNAIELNLKEWLSQFDNYNIQFIVDKGSWEWVKFCELIGEWETKPWQYIVDAAKIPVDMTLREFCEMSKKQAVFLSYLDNEAIPYEIQSSVKVGSPILPENISPVPQDLNDLIAFTKNISAKEAFNLNRQELAYGKEKFNEMFNDDFAHKRDMSLLFGEEATKLQINKHNALSDARTIKMCYINLNA